MSTMYSAGPMLVLMAFLILAVGGPMLALRIFGAHAVKGDHPRQ